MNEEIQRLIREANRFGLKGIKILGWVPPQAATDNPDGSWIVESGKQNSAADAGDSY